MYRIPRNENWKLKADILFNTMGYLILEAAWPDMPKRYNRTCL